MLEADRWPGGLSCATRRVVESARSDSAKQGVHKVGRGCWSVVVLEFRSMQGLTSVPATCCTEIGDEGRHIVTHEQDGSLPRFAHALLHHRHSGGVH